MLPAVFELRVHPGGAATRHRILTHTGSDGTSNPSGIAVYPIAGVARNICAGYGDRNGSLHDACDLCAPSGSPAVAVNDGTVSYGTDPFGGNVAILHVADGTAYYYAHLMDVQTGSRPVLAGEQIGRVDTTGNAALVGISHVHFQVWPGGSFNQGSVHPDPTADLMAAPILDAPVAETQDTATSSSWWVWGAVAALLVIGIGGLVALERPDLLARVARLLPR